MTPRLVPPAPHRAARTLGISLAALLFTSLLSGCLMVGGYSSGGGWFLWPGSLGGLLVLFLLFMLLRRRR